ncbi:DUF4349 domain-containing protein [Melghirimyces profundicolus]|nr:DUF4349 domain-containing protein [Melghirimyces profundicolus]
MIHSMWKRIGAGVLATLFLAGCSSGEEARVAQLDSKSPARSEAVEQTESFSVRGLAKTKDSRKTGGSTETDPALSKKETAVSPEKRKVVYQANLDLRVDNLKKAREKMEEDARKKDGYLVEASQSRNGHDVTGRFVFRIPQESFHAFLDELERVAQEVSSRNLSGKDVTEEFVDLKSRLKAKKAVEKRLMEMMKEAKTTEDLLKVSERLSQVQEEIEQLKGRMQYLQNRTDYATVTVQARQVAPLEKPEGEPGWGERVSHSFVQSLGWLRDLFQGIVVLGAALLPPAAVLAILFLPLLWWYRRWKKTPSGETPPGEEEDSSL